MLFSLQFKTGVHLLKVELTQLPSPAVSINDAEIFRLTFELNTINHPIGFHSGPIQLVDMTKFGILIKFSKVYVYQ